MAEYLLPDVGEGLTEAEIVAWKVKVGDVIEINDIVVEIETAKSLVELPSPYAGTVTALLVAEGETVPVGTPIIAIGDPAGLRGEPPRRAVRRVGSRDGDRPLQPGRLRQRRGREPGRPDEGRPRAGPPPAQGRPRGHRVATHMQVQGVVRDRAAPVAAGRGRRAGERRAGHGGRDRWRHPPQVLVLAKPPVRKLAKDLGVDLATVTPTGPNGTVTRADVEALPAARRARRGCGRLEASCLAAPQAGERETREPIKGVRKMMAGAMTPRPSPRRT